MQFNPSDYDYLDTVPRAGWMWEFIRRSPDYIQRYHRIEEHSQKAFLSPTSKDCILKYEFTKSSDGNVLHNELRALEKECFVRPIAGYAYLNPKHFLRIAIVGMNIKMKYKSKLISAQAYVSTPNPKVRYCDFDSRKPHIVDGTAVLYHWFHPSTARRYESQLYNKDLARVFREELTPVRLEDTLYFGVSLRENSDDIEEEIKDILGKHIKSYKKEMGIKQSRLMTDKWKSYLMIYDQVESGKSLEDVSKDLSKCNDLRLSYFSEREFKGGRKVQHLCEALLKDNLPLRGKTIKGLNQLLKETELFELLIKVRQDQKLSEDLDNQRKKFWEMPKNGDNLKRFNRWLLEDFYPQEAPKSLDFYLELINIQNHYDQASLLIKGNFRNYLLASK